MLSGFKGLIIMGLLALAAVAPGCAQDKPHEYGKERHPVDDISRKDRGLQSKDVVAASDQMAMDLLALPELNASKNQWLIVFDHMDNLTADRRQDFDIFLARLKVKVAQLGRGRVTIIENRDKYGQLQSRELTPTGNGDAYGQGGGGTNAPGSAGTNPDFSLYGKISELANRRNSYFFCEFNLTDLHSRRVVWTNAYEVNAHQ